VTDGWRARAALADVPAARGVTLFGRRLHVALADAERDLPAVLAALAAEGLAPGEARPVVPSLEDVFIAMVERAGDRGGVDARVG
jgi:ABC-2 type transport system ATP-binding protein